MDPLARLGSNEVGPPLPGIHWSFPGVSPKKTKTTSLRWALAEVSMDRAWSAHLNEVVEVVEALANHCSTKIRPSVEGTLRVLQEAPS